MCFNETNLILFKLFLKAKTPNERKEVIELIIYDYISKLYLMNAHPKNIQEKCSRCSFSQMIQNQINLVSSKNCKLKSKVFDIEYNSEEYYRLGPKHKQVLIDNQSLLNKKPYSDFIQIKNSHVLLNNSSLCQNFIHVQLHYIYYLLFISIDNPIILSFHQTRPLLYKLLSKEKSETSNGHSRPIALINSTLNFFSHNWKKHPLILQALNESSIEILIHIIILNYYYTKKIKGKFIFKFKPIQTIQTMIMLQNQNKSNLNYTYVISLLLSSFFHQSSTNIKILIKILDISNIPYGECKLLLKKIFISDFKPNMTKTLHNILDIILLLKNSNDVLKEFLIEVLMELFNNFSDIDHDSNYLAFFLFFYKETLKKFSIIVNKDKMSFDYIISNHTMKKISLKLKDFIELMIDKYSIVIKKLFPVISCLYHKSFGAIFDILTALNSNSEIYYNNIPNQHKENRRILLNYFMLNFDLVPTEVLCTKMLKHYLKPDIKTNKNIINISYGINDEEITIEILKMNSLIHRIERISSGNYQNRIINSISNMLRYYPFNEINTLCTLLEMIINSNQLEEEREEIVSLDNSLLSKEDEEEISKSIEIINQNSNLYRNKFIEEIFYQLNTLSIEDIIKLKNPIKVMISALKHFIKINNENLITLCFNSLLVAIKSNNVIIISLSCSFEILTLINEININNSLPYSDDLLSLISEVKALLMSISNDNIKENQDEDNSSHYTKENEIDSQLTQLMNEVKDIKYTIENSYSIKKLILFLSNTKPNPSIQLKTMKSLFDVAMKHLTESNSAFYLELSIKLFTAIYLYVKQSKDCRSYFLKLIKEELMNVLVYKMHNQIILEKLFEVLVKTIKKIKKSTCFIANDLLQIIFDIFEQHLLTLNPISLSSCLSLLSYIIEYSHMEICSQYNTIIRTGINFLSSHSSTNEIKRASAFLLMKILKHLSSEELQPYSSLIFTAINNQMNNSKDNVLSYHLSQCLEYYS